MQLHDLNLNLRHTRKKQRIGRGGKRGSFSGRGVKGQKSRAGRRIRPAERDLIIRIPKLRGFRNKPQDGKPIAINIEAIMRKAKALGKNAVVNLDTLKQVKLVPMQYRGEVKILSKGGIEAAVRFEGFKFSAGAKAKIEKAGGSVT